MGNNLWQREFVEELKRKTGYKIVALLHLDQYIKADVKNSEMVCTDSFHGTVFSLIYSKQFFTFMRFSDKATLSTNSRITTLLKCIGVEDRLVCQKTDLESLLNSKMDIDEIQSRISKFRSASLHYLKNALEGK